MKCDYGCDNTAKFVLKNGKNCCSKYSNSCEEIRRKNSIACKKSHSKASSRRNQKDVYKSLPEETKEKMTWNKGVLTLSFDEVFARNGYSTGLVKKYYIHYTNNNSCSICGIDSWNGKELCLELDHINGNNSDNVITNLRLVCPNCHAQTDNFRGRNINSGQIKVPDELLIKALNESKSIRAALQKVGLAAKGGNYNRAYKLLNNTRESGEVG